VTEGKGFHAPLSNEGKHESGATSHSSVILASFAPDLAGLSPRDVQTAAARLEIQGTSFGIEFDKGAPMPEPYRTSARPNHPAKEERPCDLCGSAFLPAAEDVDICASCLRKASLAAERIENAKKKDRRTPARSAFRLLGYTSAATTLWFVFVFLPSYVHYQLTVRLASSVFTLAQSVRDMGAEVRPAKRHRNKSHAPPIEEPPRAAPEARLEDLPRFPSVLSSLLPESHDPDVLLARVEKLRKAGLDIVLLRAEIHRDLLDAAFADANAGVSPLTVNGKTLGLKLTRLGPASFGSLAGLQSGDVLVSINGYDISSPEDALHGYESARMQKSAVVELVRGGRRVVLDVRLD